MKKGTHLLEETKRKISQTLKGRKPKVAGWNKGRKHSEETKLKMSKNNARYWKGKKRPLSEETKKKMSESRKGEKSYQWKGGISKNKEYRSWLKNKRNRLKKIQNQNGSSHTFGEWEILKAQYNWTCPVCRKKEPEIKLTEDHIIPLSKGGSDNIENIQPLCRSCNSRKNNKIIKLQNSDTKSHPRSIRGVPTSIRQSRR